MAGDKIILDNGAYENQIVDDRYLANCVQLLKPTVVVLPDLPGDPKETLIRSANFQSFLSKKKIAVETMYVVHSDGTLRSSQAYTHAKHTIPEITWVAFSRLTKHYGTDVDIRVERSRQRVHFAYTLKKLGMWNRALHHHALGMLDGSIEELWALRRQGFASCDSSAPIWRGLNGYTMLDPWPDHEFNPFDEKANNWALALTNLKEVFEACR